jgi:PDZ domain-containing secreted protein
MKHMRILWPGFLGLLGLGLIGCDTLEDINPFSNEQEAQGLVESLGDNTLTVDGIAYTVTSDTEFEGIDSLADLQVGDEVEIEYEENNGTREALEIELAGAEDDD